MYTIHVKSDKNDTPVQWLAAEFAHGPIPRSLDTDGAGVAIKAQGREDEELKDGVELTLETKKLHFSGKAARRPSESSQYVLGVMNSKKKRITVLPAGSGAVVSMKHHVKDYQPKLPDDHSHLNRGTYVREFASHREHKRLKDYMDSYVRGQQVAIADHMQQAQKEAREAEEAARRPQHENLPALDAETNDPELIYQVPLLMSGSLQANLLKVMEERFTEDLFDLEAAGAMSDRVDERCRAFYLHMLPELVATEAGEERQAMVAALGYVLAMCDFLVNSHPTPADRDAASSSMNFDGVDASSVTRQLNLCFASRPDARNFFKLGQSGRVRCINFGVVAMILCSKTRTLRLDDICSVFGLTRYMARRYAAATGLTLLNALNKAEGEVTLRLKAPLKVPKLTQKGALKKGLY